MRRLADRARVAWLAGTLLLVACEAAPTPSPVPSVSPTPEPASATETASVTPSPTATDAAGLDVPAAGRPWTADGLLAEMRDSSRPGGVPEAAQTAEVAAAIADAVWTVDGAAWDTSAIGGFCGTDACTLDLAGSHLGRAGEDLWTLRIDLATGDVEPLVAEVRSLPFELVDELDALARSLDDDLDGSLVLTTARWLPPPAEDGRFALSYRSGGEEGSCAIELVLDAIEAEIVERDATGC